mmetsp:Transcript_107705/g.300109  ORF Transcript_107705/g.300109 Transcript_107705/m.300109 type:complete len:355 (-) Transcript_107705:9-1073(-)
MFSTVSDDALVALLTSLPVKDIAAMMVLNRPVCSVALAKSVWGPLCEQLWEGKDVPERFVALRDGGKPREAYRRSLEDSRRTRITPGELQRILWSFRFKAAAGESWQSSDPWWQGQAATAVRFRADGTARFARGALFQDRPPQIRWKLVRFHDSFLRMLNERANIAARDAPFSEFDSRGVHARVMGRDVPTYCVRRNLCNWGWIMESCWVVWTSWPMPLRNSPEAAELDDDRLPVTFEVQRFQAMSYNAGMAARDEALLSDDAGSEDDEPGVDASAGEGSSGEAAESVSDDEEEPNHVVIVQIGSRLVRIPQRLLLEAFSLRDVLEQETDAETGDEGSMNNGMHETEADGSTSP